MSLFLYLRNQKNILKSLIRVINKPKDKNGMKGVSISFLRIKLYVAGNNASSVAKKIADIPR